MGGTQGPFRIAGRYANSRQRLSPPEQVDRAAGPLGVGAGAVDWYRGNGARRPWSTQTSSFLSWFC